MVNVYTKLRALEKTNQTETHKHRDEANIDVVEEKRVTIVDNTFYDGEPVLLFRLATLYEKVDRFYIVESKYTMDGKLKTSLHKDMNAELFEPYKDKIQWIEHDQDLGTVTLDERKRQLRETYVSKAKADLEEGIISEPFVVINAEVDEIINPNDIDDFQPGRKLHNLVTQVPVILIMDSFEYNLNWKREEKVTNADILPGRLFTETNFFHGIDAMNTGLYWRITSKIKSGYRLANFFDFDALSNKVRYPESRKGIQFVDDLRDDACAVKCVSEEEQCKWERCNIGMKQWDYKQAPASFQRFHELICGIQNVDPVTGVVNLINDSSRKAFSSVVPLDIEIGDNKDWESVAEIPYAGEKVTVVDSILYNGEPILLTRLATLYDVVDRFYISEGTHSFAGDKKENLYKDLDAHLFEPYKDKIHWLVFDMSEYAKEQVWDREHDCRRSPLASIREHFEKGEITHPFVILNTDADELPEPRDVAAFQPGQKYHESAISTLTVFQMNFFYYNLNWKQRTKWPRASAVPGHLAFTMLSDMEECRQDDTLRIAANQLEGGYHMSFFLVCGRDPKENRDIFPSRI